MSKKSRIFAILAENNPANPDTSSLFMNINIDLEKLIYLKCIGGRHTSKDNVIKGFPKHERGNIKKELGTLIKKGYILQKPTSYGIRSLNQSKNAF